MSDHTLTELQVIVHEWANEQFPDRPPAAGWMKLFEELGEVIRDPTDRLEWADVFIMLLDLASIYGVTLDGSIIEKMQINRQRVWGKTATGVMSHVPGAVQPVTPPPMRVVFKDGPLGQLLGPRDMPWESVPVEWAPAGYDGPGNYLFDRTDFGMDRRPTHYYIWVPF